MEEYLIPKPFDVAILLPPLMHLAWIVDKERMFDYALEHGVNAIVSDHLGSRRNYYAACNEAMICLLEDLGIPSDDRIDVVFVCNGDYQPRPTDPNHQNFQLAVRIGTNYEGAVSDETVALLQDFIAPGVKPRWFLDSDEWQWVGAPRFDKLKGTSWLFFRIFSLTFRLYLIDAPPLGENRKKGAPAVSTNKSNAAPL